MLYGTLHTRTRLWLWCFLATVIGAASPLRALDLPAGAVLTAKRQEAATLQPFPISAYTGENTSMLSAEGRIEHSAYRVSSTALTTYQLMEPLRAQLEADGFSIPFVCADTICGGFDFRFLLDLLPEPMMHVDLGDFQYLLARHPDGRVVAIVTSRAPRNGFIHLTVVTPQGQDAETITPTSKPLADTTVTKPTQIQQNPFADRLLKNGAVPLDDLTFETGSSALAGTSFDSLSDLAEFLAAAPEARVVLVGHTDAVGSLAANIDLSRKRAASVRDSLVTTYGVLPDQLSAEGIGYLAPRASNTTPEGRQKNRRVEAVLTSTPQ